MFYYSNFIVLYIYGLYSMTIYTIQAIHIPRIGREQVRGYRREGSYEESYWGRGGERDIERWGEGELRDIVKDKIWERYGERGFLSGGVVREVLR